MRCYRWDENDAKGDLFLSKNSVKCFSSVFQGPVVQRVDNFTQQINPYPVDKTGMFSILIGQRANFIHWIGIYLMVKVIHSLYNRAQFG